MLFCAIALESEALAVSHLVHRENRTSFLGEGLLDVLTELNEGWLWPQASCRYPYPRGERTDWTDTCFGFYHHLPSFVGVYRNDGRPHINYRCWFRVGCTVGTVSNSIS